MVYLVTSDATNFPDAKYHGTLWFNQNQSYESEFIGSCIAPDLESYLKDNQDIKVLENHPKWVKTLN